MKTDSDLERLLRDVLREELDDAYGPDPAWDESPAARQVADERRRRPRRRVVRLLAVAALLSIGVGSAFVLGSPAEPPTADIRSGWIAYGLAPEDGGDHDIWFASLDGEVRRTVGTDTDRVDQLCPAFSADGRRLAYGEVDRSSGTPSLAVVVADVGDDGSVTHALRVDFDAAPPCPTWSPTGDRIAFGVPLTSVTNPTRSAEGSAVWIVSVADGTTTVLPDLLATDLEFSPDGSRLAIASGDREVVTGNRLHDGQLHVHQLDTGETAALEGTEGAVTLTWSPSGGRIAYERIADATGDSVSQLVVIDLASGEQRPLSTGRYDDYGAIHGIGPVWSPDGESIVYQRCRPRRCDSEDHDVVVVWPDDLAADGTPREAVIPLTERLADGSERALDGPYWITWSPDGEHLLFATWSSEIDPLLGVVRPLAGEPSTILVTTQEVATNPVYEYGPFMPMQSWGRSPTGTSPSAFATDAPRVGASPSAEPSLVRDPIDTSGWLPFTSGRYGFSIAHPQDWEATPASGEWTFPDDTAWPDGVERADWFYLDGEDGSVAASAWSVELEPGQTADQWFLDYCAIEVTPCLGDEPRVPISLDGHPGWFVPASDPQAYFGIGDRIYLLVIWQPEDHPALARYGGGGRLVEAFVSTMRLLPNED